LSTEEQIEMVRQCAARALELGQNPYGGWKQATQAKEKRSRVIRFAGEEAMMCTIETRSRPISEKIRLSKKD